MSDTTHTRLTPEERALSAPVLTGLAGGFISMLAGLAIELQAPASCLETVVASLAIVTNNLWAAAAIACPVSPPHALYIFRTAWSLANTMTLVALVIAGAFYPSRGEASPLAILGIFVLELIGLLAVSAAAALSPWNDDEMSSAEDVASAEDTSPMGEASPVEETILKEETSPAEHPEQNLTPEQHMQRSREMLERAETLLINCGAVVNELHWHVDVFRATIEEINSTYPRGWDPNHQRQGYYYDENYAENYNNSGFLAAYHEALARQGIYGGPNQHLVDESGCNDDYPEDAEDERGYYGDYVEEEDDNDFYCEDQYASRSEEPAYVEETEWAGEPAHIVHHEDAESDESSMPDLVADGGMIIV